MPKVDFNQIHLFILRYRKILIALGFSFIVWSIAQNPPDGKVVLIANQYIPANSKFELAQFAEVRVAGFDTDQFVNSFSLLRSAFAKSDIAMGSLIAQEELSSNSFPTNRVDVFISLDSQLPIKAGSKLHLWANSDEFKHLVSNDAVVRSSETDSYGTRLRVSVPMSDEYSVMQSDDIQVVMVN